LAEISHVTRQRVDWQREAARDLSEGRFEEALRAFARNQVVIWTTRQEDTRAKLIEQWSKDSAADPKASRFVFAYTNKDVDALNRDLRAVRRARGELGVDHVFTTKHGEAAFAVGNRVQFTDTLKGARIYNGNAGTVTRIDRDTGRISADARRGGRARGASGRVVGIGVRRLPARLRRDDLQGAGQDPRPHLSASHPTLAGGFELCGADPPAGEHQGVRGVGHGAGHPPARPADRAGRDQGGLDRLCDGRRADAGAEGASGRSGDGGS
jgi:hypothetical protein